MGYLYGLAQGSATIHPQAHKYLLHCINLVFCKNYKFYINFQEKKILKEILCDNTEWITRNIIHGWIVYPLCLVIYLKKL